MKFSFGVGDLHHASLNQDVMKNYGPYTPIVVLEMKNPLNLPLDYKKEALKFTRITDVMISLNRHLMEARPDGKFAL